MLNRIDVQNNPVNYIDPEGLMIAIIVPPDKGNRDVDPITDQVIDDWREVSQSCPDCYHPEIDWECVWSTVDLLTGGSSSFSNELRVGMGTVGGIDLIVKAVAGSSTGVGALVTTYGASIIYGAMIGCTKCVPDKAI